MSGPANDRTDLLVDVLSEAFAPLMAADPGAFRVKFRKMATDPFAFYRGSACVFYEGMRELDDPYANERTGRVWIHGDLHVENFGTYMNSEGVLVFDVNDFDEAYVGHFSWDLRRFAASLALMCWQKALPESDIRALIAGYLRAYADQVRHYVDQPRDESYALRLDNTSGAIRQVLRLARSASRIAMLDSMTERVDHDRRFIRDGRTRDLDERELGQVEQAFATYLQTIPERKRQHREVFYDVKDVVGRKGFGIGSAGLPAYNVLIEGFNQALENDVVLSVKQGNVPAVSRVVTDHRVRDYFEHEGQRTVASQRALQVHTDPFLGYTRMGDTGFVVAEVSPYETDLDWSDITEPDQMTPVLEALGRATAKVHCVSDADSDEDLVTFQTEGAIAEVISDDEDAFVEHLVEFGVGYAGTTRSDHALFVEAFRGGRFDLVSAT